MGPDTPSSQAASGRAGLEAAPTRAVATARPSATDVEYALLRELYGPRKPLLAGNLGGAALLAAVLWESAAQYELVLWAILIAGITLMRHSLVRRFNTLQPGPEATAFWTWSYAAGAFAGGVLWGASVGLFSSAGADANDQTFVLIVAGLSAAGLSGYAVCPVVFVAFLVPATLPFAWYLFHTPAGAFKPGAAALFFCWLALTVVVAYWRSRRIADTIGREGAATERSLRDELERERRRQESETKARVVAQLSHELRTPLNAIVGFSEAIKHGVFGPVGNPRYSAYADNIHDSGRHLLAVIERALVDRALGSEMPAMEEADVELRAVASEAAAMFEARARQCGVALVVTCEEPAPAIRGNAEKLKQVLVNLLSNAVKFTPPGGRIAVEIATPPGAGAVMRVSDTGVGMDKSQIARALDPVLSARRKPDQAQAIGTDSGRGVGLLIAKWLTELHGGKLLIESTRGVGTAATVQLPRERLLLRVRGDLLSSRPLAAG
jgi:signal transduction histidine kinase